PIDEDAELAVAGDHVAGAGPDPPDDEVGLAVKVHAGIRVAQGGSPGEVGADEVAQHLVDTVAAHPKLATHPLAVAGDDVARPGHRTADHVVGSAHARADTTVAQGAGARAVGADVVALHPVVRAPDGDPERIPRD